MPMTEPPPQSAEGKLLADAMLRRKWKAPRLARESGGTDGWVQAQIRGYRNVGKGLYEPVRPDAALLATLAHALGNISEDDLIEIGRSDAAERLKTLRREAPGAGGVAARLTRIRDDIDSIIRELGPQ